MAIKKMSRNDRHNGWVVGGGLVGLTAEEN